MPQEPRKLNHKKDLLIQERVPYRQLTREITVHSDWRGVGRSVVGVFSIFVLLNAAAFYYLDSYTLNLGYWLIKKKWSLLYDLESPVDWLILGDSSGNQSVDPGVFGKTVNGTALNLCTMGNMAALDDAWMLNYYIGKFGAPKHVLIVHAHHVWTRNVDPVVIAQIPALERLWGTLIPRPKLDKHEMIDLILARYLPLYGSNISLRASIGSPNLLFQSPFRVRQSGYMPWYIAQPEGVEQSANSFATGSKAFTISPINREAIRDIANLAEQHGFDVFIVQSPLYTGLYQDERLRDYFNQVDKALRVLASESQHLHFIPDVIHFPSNLMENPDHLVHSASEQYTKKVGELILKSGTHD